MKQDRYGDTDMPSVSVIVPCYNDLDYLHQCLDSVLSQTLYDLELICVDDSSTDGSTEVIRKYEATDSRVKAIYRSETGSALQARIDGIRQSRGAYIMFLDADDYLDFRACEDLVRQAKQAKVDILHFGTNIIDLSAGEPKVLSELKRVLKPLERRLVGNIFDAAFVHDRFGHTLWSKIFRGDLVREAIRSIEYEQQYLAEDLYMFFVISHFASSYKGIAKKYHNYRFGSGVTGHKWLDVESFSRQCDQKKAVDAIERFAKSTGIENRIVSARRIADRLLDGCIAAWIYRLPIALGSEGFDILLSRWSVADVARRMYVNRSKYVQAAARRVIGAKSLAPSRRENFRTVGFFYRRMKYGGIERVLSQLLPLLERQGLKVVLFTEQFEPEAEFPIPASIKRVVLPLATDYEARCEVLSQSLLEHDIDIYAFQSPGAPTLLPDMLVVKSAGIPAIVTVHHFALHLLLGSGKEFFLEPDLLRVADGISVLSPVDEYYWRCLGVKAKFLQNPAEYSICSTDDVSPESGLLLWVGRLDPESKRCLDLVDVMNVVAAEVPEARLLVVGSQWGAADLARKMKDRAAQVGVQDKIEFVDETLDVEQYYKRASLYILTSMSEGSPMVIMEAKAHGLPVVMYDIPHLRTLGTIGEAQGAVIVESGNTEELARAVIAILRDDARRALLAQNARESLKRYKSFPLGEAWKEFLDEVVCGDFLANGFASTVPAEDGKALMSELVSLQQFKWERDQLERRDMPGTPLTMRGKLAKAIEHPRWAARATLRRLRKLRAQKPKTASLR